MTREEKISAIYKEMANKERSIGCGINVKYRAYYHGETGGEVSYSKEDDLIVGVDGVARNGDIELSKADLSEADPNGYIEALETLVKIIGHPVMIGDVLSYFERKDRIMTSVGEFEGTIENPTSIKEEYHIRDKIAKILYLYTSKTEPIEKQPDECIDYVYSLIGNKNE